ncbi:fibroblast growth factor receptor 2-like isoform X2 [Hydractinia symbiolongicarpus]|uniref:fibroblast growth factor receptor 2-like isoform X2 n=1 Tax=Hydractinia symbiolongicarpus TaxID=13093 RepID=UPI002550D521|nr:fibroblast growth factor receptor 2-like isoform X2 [Hydractinia symbiolongicarpus]
MKIQRGCCSFLLVGILYHCKILKASTSMKEIRSGEQIKLECTFKNPTKDVLWLKDNKTINFENSRYLLRKSGKVFKIRNVGERDIGIYSCNDVTEGQPHKELIAYNVSLVKEDQLHFTNKKKMELNKNRMSPSGTEITFYCKADGEGPIKYKWFKDNKLLLTRRVDSTLVVNQPTLKLKTLVVSDSAVYTCRAENKDGSIEFNYTLTVKEQIRTTPYLEKGSVKNQTRYVGDNTTIECYELISGTIPDFRWLKWKGAFNQTVLKKAADSDLHDVDQNVLEVLNVDLFKEISRSLSGMNPNKKNIFGVELVLVNLTVNDSGYYTCLASNHIGSDSANMYLNVLPRGMFQQKLQESEEGPNMTMLIVIAVLGMAVVFTLSCMAIGCVYWRKKKPADHTGVIFTDGNMTKLNLDSDKPRRMRGLSSNGSFAPLLSNGSVRSTSESRAMYGDLEAGFEIPFDPEWEIDRDCLHITETLGEGAFGVVVKAQAVGLKKCEEHQTSVAIKMLKADAVENELLDLLSEMETMKTIGRHQNIINFIGCCTQSDPVYVVVEYAPHGNLRQYLRSKRPPPSDSDERPKPLLATKDMVSYALQIAKGMEYLASRKCIHRDLAARNVLVGENYVIKIADFGLARSTNDIDYYRKTTDGRLPVKWLAIEALFDRIYTTQSDVWAFGVLLWEIFTLGGSPYPGIPVERLFDLLKSGFRMDKPQVCPSEIYEIMVKCWYENPSNRPSFTDLLQELESLLEELTSQEYIQVLAPSVSSLTCSSDDDDESDDYEIDVNSPFV